MTASTAGLLVLHPHFAASERHGDEAGAQPAKTAAARGGERCRSAVRWWFAEAHMRGRHVCTRAADDCRVLGQGRRVPAKPASSTKRRIEVDRRAGLASWRAWRGLASRGAGVRQNSVVRHAHPRTDFSRRTDIVALLRIRNARLRFALDSREPFHAHLLQSCAISPELHQPRRVEQPYYSVVAGSQRLGSDESVPTAARSCVCTRKPALAALAPARRGARGPHLSLGNGREALRRPSRVRESPSETRSARQRPRAPHPDGRRADGNAPRRHAGFQPVLAQLSRQWQSSRCSSFRAHVRGTPHKLARHLLLRTKRFIYIRQRSGRQHAYGLEVPTNGTRTVSRRPPKQLPITHLQLRIPMTVFCDGRLLFSGWSHSRAPVSLEYAY